VATTRSEKLQNAKVKCFHESYQRVKTGGNDMFPENCKTQKTRKNRGRKKVSKG
jgi:hypothetical protein